MNHVIDDVYMNYLLCNKDLQMISSISKKSKATIKKYIDIKENLHDDLYQLFSTKKITIDIALYLIKHIFNPEHQLCIYPSLINFKTPDKKIKISQENICDICCGNSKLFEITPCCQNKLCLSCLRNIVLSSSKDIQFQLLSCPFCRDIFPLDYLYMILKVGDMKSFEPWRNKYEYEYNYKIYNDEKFGRCIKYYLHNTIYKYKYNLQQIIQSNHIDDHSLEMIKEELTNHIYSNCYHCVQKWYGNHKRFHEKQYFSDNSKMKYISLGTIEKQCVNNDTPLKRNMFLCQPCFDKHNSGEFKKCPHCGIKTLKPNGCNFVKCKCGNKWCFVCNLRLPNTHEGHNVHYYIGYGSGPYDDHCRISTNYKGETHILQECNCKYCRERNGAPLCKNIDCYRPTNFNKKYSQTKKGLFYNMYCDQCL
jgi:hypothetical protein